MAKAFCCLKEAQHYHHMQRSKRTTISELNDFPRLILAGTDPILFLGEGTAPRNDVTDRCGKQNLKANRKKKGLSQGGGGAQLLF